MKRIKMQFTEYIKIGFDFMARELTGMFFDPVVGCVVGGLSDIISYMVKPVGDISMDLPSAR